MSEQKGDELVEAANKKLSSMSLFGNKYDDAIDKFQKAAAQYKIAKSWEKAGDALIRAAEIAESRGDSIDAMSFYKKGAEMYKKVAPEEAARIYMVLAVQHMENNNFSTAAKMYKTVGELFEEEKEYQEALDAYQQAADSYIAEDQEANSHNMLLKVAHYAALLEDYQRAVEVFEQIGDASVNNDLRKWGCRKHYFNSLLCLLALHAKTGDMDAVENKLYTYVGKYPAFEGTREEKFIDVVISSVKDLNYEQFQEALYEFDTISKFDDWQSSLLIKVKGVVRDGVGGDDEDEDGVFE